MTQTYLNDICQKPEASYFLSNVTGWCSHQPLLYLGLELTKGSNLPILEMGCGDGSTIQLHKYVQSDVRKLISFDTNQIWLEKYSHLASQNHEFVYHTDPLQYNSISQKWEDSSNSVKSWLEKVSERGLSVCLIDHASGERRHIDIQTLANRCDVMVIHDTEPEATGYMLDKIWDLFKYRLNLKFWPAYATIVSNKYDVSEFNGLKISEFELSI